MQHQKLKDRRTIECAVLAALFPLWGIGSLELLVRTAAELPQTALEYSEATFKAGIAGLFSFALFSAGTAFLIRAILLHQQQRTQFLSASANSSNLNAVKIPCVIDVYNQDYDSPNESNSFESVSYTRLWYLSFQNHLGAKAGFDTLKLAPLKRWPAILQKQMLEDLVPVWNFPLLLIVMVSIPALALLIAGVDRVFCIFTGASFCAGCYDFVNAIVSFISSTVWNLLNNPSN